MTGAVLVLGAGVAAGLMAAGGDAEEPVSNKKIPASALPREPTETAEPTSPEPTKSEAPAKPAPTTTSPPPSSPAPEPTDTPTSEPSVPGVSEAEWAREFAERWREKYGAPGPGRTHWEHHEHGDGYQYDYEYSYDYDYQQGE
ncbi:hypothetical protein GCM10012287_18520 [Streptomyces daqingensis]|uniref:Uncharacterized protein n=1 Tax=Streptomyces daqingensis TaxID=1472640 RepID=A0ABQ2M538_9ACTN|nr:hypothetical protein [Streptomyces daqingensis]GGO46972.1 hypothetical protein GCM10012287_18520 [Streptomyces daqingensis]